MNIPLELAYALSILVCFAIGTRMALIAGTSKEYRFGLFLSGFPFGLMWTVVALSARLPELIGPGWFLLLPGSWLIGIATFLAVAHFSMWFVSQVNAMSDSTRLRVRVFAMTAGIFVALGAATATSVSIAAGILCIAMGSLLLVLAIFAEPISAWWGKNISKN